MYDGPSRKMRVWEKLLNHEIIKKIITWTEKISIRLGLDTFKSSSQLDHDDVFFGDCGICDDGAPTRIDCCQLRSMIEQLVPIYTKSSPQSYFNNCSLKKQSA